MRIHPARAVLLSLILAFSAIAQTRTQTEPVGPTGSGLSPGERGWPGVNHWGGLGVTRGRYGFWYPEEYATLMRLLGYHSAKEHTRESLTAATNAFQYDHGLPVTGYVDEDTEEGLRERYRQLDVRLALCGFRHKEDTLGVTDPGRQLPDLSGLIRAYERSVGLPETGVFRGAVWESLRRDAALSAALDEAAKTLPFGRVLLASRSSGSSRSYLLGHGDTIEAWHFDEGKVTGRAHGLDAVRDLDAATFDAFKPAGPYTFVLQVPPHLAHTPPAIFLNGWIGEESARDIVSGKSRWPGLEGLIAQARESGLRPRFFVHRSTIKQAGLPAVQLGPYLGGSTLDIPDSLELAVALQRRYGTAADIFLINDVDRAVQNLNSLPRVEAGSQIRVYVDKKGFQDFKTVDHLRPSLKHAHIEAVRVGDVQSNTPKIALIIGHNTADARALISDLGRDGHFRGSIVALAVCGQGGEVPFNTKLILDSGARGVLFYDQRIKQVAVERALYQLCDLIQKEGLKDGDIQSLLRRAVDRALKNVELTDSERADLRLLRGSVLQLSNLRTANFEAAA